MERPDFFELKNGEKVKLPFSNKEYDQRVNKLRLVMDKNNLDMIILTSMHNIAYYTGFIYCSFWRPYGCVITEKKIVTKFEPKKEENNVINLEVKKETPKVFNEPQEEEPLILTNEVKENKNNSSNENNEILSPAVRKIVFENKIDLEKVRGTGKEGRILKGDLIGMMGENPQPSERKIKHGPEERVRMTRLRSTIAKRLKEAQENAAMLTTFNEVDMSEVMKMRSQYKEEFQNKYKVKLGFM